jgi:hypothetical protein
VDNGWLTGAVGKSPGHAGRAMPGERDARGAGHARSGPPGGERAAR